MNALTEVELVWIKGKIERWIRFGHAVEEHILDRQHRIVTFAPDSIFCFVRWAANDFGTLVSRMDVLRCCREGEQRSALPGVRPGAQILLRLHGWEKVEQGLKAIDCIETLGITGEEVCPDYWRHVHNRLVTGLPPGGYTLERHNAWRLRQKLLPPC